MDYDEFYSELYRELEEKFGALDEETLTSIVGFSAGGPVSLKTRTESGVNATCELAVYPEQLQSAEGLNYELLSIRDFSTDWCRSVFTAIGSLSMQSSLGDGHTIDISKVVEKDDPVKKVRLHLFSKTTFGGREYGLYRVVPA